jgi:hypothetical protein
MHQLAFATEKERHHWLALTSNGLVRSTSPFCDRVPLRRVTSLEPKLVAEVSYASVTPNGRRAPVFRGLLPAVPNERSRASDGLGGSLFPPVATLLSDPKTKPDTQDAANSTADHPGDRD